MDYLDCKESWKRLCYALAECKLPARCVFIGIFVLFIGIFCFSTEAYIEGPWLWMIASGADIDNDQLAVASDGKVTENLVAAYGVNEGDAMGHLRWTRGRILPTVTCILQWCYSNNVTDVVTKIGLNRNRWIDNHSAYALINIRSPREQRNVLMGVGSDDSVKIWLNGEVVHVNQVNRRTEGIQDRFRVNLKTGTNFLLVKVTDIFWNWGMFFDIYLDAEDYTATLPTRIQQVSLAQHIFEEYRTTLQQSDIQRVLPTVLDRFQDPEIQQFLTPFTIETVVTNPNLLSGFGVSEETITFIKGNADIRTMFNDPDFQTLLQNPDAFSEFSMLVTESAPERLANPADVDNNGSVNVQDLTFVASTFRRGGTESCGCQ